jgi:ketopantoate reductase
MGDFSLMRAILFDVKVYSSPPDTAPRGQFAYIVVTSKALPNIRPSLVDLLSPFVTPEYTTIVLVQNGVGIEKDVAEAWPENVVLSGVVAILFRWPFIISDWYPSFCERHG